MASKLEQFQIVRIRQERGTLEPAVVIDHEEVGNTVLVQTETEVKIVDREDIES